MSQSSNTYMSNVSRMQVTWQIYESCHTHIMRTTILTCGLATIRRLLKITGLFGTISSLLQGSFAKETYDLKETTNRSHPHSHVRYASDTCVCHDFFTCVTWLNWTSDRAVSPRESTCNVCVHESCHTHVWIMLHICQSCHTPQAEQCRRANLRHGSVAARIDMQHMYAWIMSYMGHDSFTYVWHDSIEPQA